jgi:hypothetical protein
MINCEDVFYQEIGIICKTFARLKVIERENKMMRECLEMICLDNIYIGQDGWKDEYFLVVKNAKECLNKLTKDKR